MLRIGAFEKAESQLGLRVSAKGVVLADHKVLLLQSPDGTWDLPGGKVEPGEDVLDGLIREVQEETGLIVQPQQLISAANKTRRESRDVLRLFFLCRASVAPKPRHVTLSAEHKDCAFLPLSKAHKIKLPPRYRAPVAAAARLLTN